MWGLTAKPDIRVETGRAKSQRQRILIVLKKGGLITNIELSRIALNYTMRISELRKDGHQILAEYIRPGVYRYIYKGHCDD